MRPARPAVPTCPRARRSRSPRRARAMVGSNSGGGMARRSEWAARYGPCVAMLLVQLFYALVDVAQKTANALGMRPIVFVAYRQAVAAVTLLVASLVAGRGSLRQMAVGPRAFALVFAASLATAMGQFFYFQGLHLASSSMARATTNLSPGITFAIAAVIGIEKVDLRSVRTAAKIAGTVVCLVGAAVMAFFKGPKLLGAVLLSVASDWVKGGIYLVGNAACVSVWYILQMFVCKSYLDPLSLATWMCILATLQCAVMAFFIEPNFMEIWKLTSFWEYPCILYGGVFASGANFFLLSWCISVKGPLYSAIFTPLSAVITAVLSVTFMSEELHVGSILGAFAIISGLYMVLWGKAEDAKSSSTDSKGAVDTDYIGVTVECRTDLSEPLLSENADENTQT